MTVDRNETLSYLIVICVRMLREAGDASHPMTTTLRSQGTFVFRCDDADQVNRLEAGLKTAIQEHASSAPRGLVMSVSQPISSRELGQHQVSRHVSGDVSPEQCYLELVRFVEQGFANQLASIEARC